MPCDFWMFPNLKKEFCGQKFDTDAEVKSAVQQFFKVIPEVKFKKTIHIKRPDRKRQCIIHADGRYFKKHLKPSNLSDYDIDLSASDSFCYLNKGNCKTCWVNRNNFFSKCCSGATIERNCLKFVLCIGNESYLMLVFGFCRYSRNQASLTVVLGQPLLIRIFSTLVTFNFSILILENLFVFSLPDYLLIFIFCPHFQFFHF